MSDTFGLCLFTVVHALNDGNQVANHAYLTFYEAQCLLARLTTIYGKPDLSLDIHSWETPDVGFALSIPPSSINKKGNPASPWDLL